jgi:hypothetical protein
VSTVVLVAFVAGACRLVLGCSFEIVPVPGIDVPEGALGRLSCQPTPS